MVVPPLLLIHLLLIVVELVVAPKPFGGLFSRFSGSKSNNNSKKAESSSSSSAQQDQHQQHVMVSAVRRLQQEMQIYQKGNKKDQFIIEPDEQNILVWKVKMKEQALAENSPLAKDMQKLAKDYDQDHLLFEFKFPEDFPFAPPFVRLLKPVIYGGHVMQGGVMCMELMGTKGWRPSCNVESIVQQIAYLLVEDDGRIVFNELGNSEQIYTLEEAQTSYEQLKGLKPEWFLSEKQKPK